MKKTVLGIFVSVFLLFAVSAVFADVRMSKTYSDNACLQRDMPVKIQGWADAGEAVTVKFGDKTAKTTACEKGCWQVTLPAMPGTFVGKDLVISGKNTVTFKNVVVGEVWICSGQSNMEQPLNSWGQPRLACTEEEFTGDYSFVRFNRATHVITDKPLDDVACAGWQLCKDNVQKGCTACGFHFAVRLSKELNVPVGLIDSNWGGSNINSWIPENGWKAVPELVSIKEKYDADRAAGTAVKDWNKFGGMFNAMLAPWENYTIRGAIWYQGESNAGEREFYYFKQKAMIQEWRKLWGQGDFPFYWVQLANFTAPSDDPNNTGTWPGLRDGQTKCLNVANTGQAVIIDIGEEKDIHPRNKFDVGNRLALWALAGIFKKSVEPQSPTFDTIKVDGKKAIVTFTHVGKGLIVGQKDGRNPVVVDKTGKLNRFAIAGPDKNFYWANAKIVGNNTVELTCDKVAQPVAVRYAWQMNPTGCNLYSVEGLPATPFRTDAW